MILCIATYRSDARVIGATIVCALAVAAWVAFTYGYYGDVLPTSFYVKLPAPEGFGELARGVVYVLSFGFLTLAIPAAILRFGKREESSEDRRVIVRMLALGMAAETLYAVFAGDKHMMYAYRLFVPYLPSLMLLLSDAGGDRDAVSRRGGGTSCEL